MVNVDLNVFPEFGVQRFAHHKLISCHIEAKTGLRFCILIEPDLDIFDGRNFPDETGLYASEGSSNMNDGSSSAAASGKEKAKGEDTESEGQAKTKSKEAVDNSKGKGRADEESSDDADSESDAFMPPPFHLVAQIYIDGLVLPDAANVVYLDPNEPRYASSVVLKNRWVEEVDGTMGQRYWVFSEALGVDTISSMVEGMVLNNEAGQASSSKTATAEQPAIEDVNSKLKKPTKFSNIGKIVVEIKRSVVMYEEPDFAPRFKAHDGTDQTQQPPKGLFPNHVTHKTTLETGENYRYEDFTHRPCGIIVRNYIYDEPLYARFEFNYISGQKLRKLNFMSENGDAIDRKDWALAGAKETSGAKRGNDDVSGDEDDSAENVAKVAKQLHDTHLSTSTHASVSAPAIIIRSPTPDNGNLNVSQGSNVDRSAVPTSADATDGRDEMMSDM